MTATATANAVPDDLDRLRWAEVGELASELGGQLLCMERLLEPFGHQPFGDDHLVGVMDAIQNHVLRNVVKKCNEICAAVDAVERGWLPAGQAEVQP